MAIVERVGGVEAPALVSVVVCTAGERPHALRTCISSLRALRDPRFEIVIVDNGRVATVASDDLASAGCRVVREPRRGLDRARNRGIEAAAGELIAFVDDDCEADPDWLAHVRRAFADNAVGCVTGRVRAASIAVPAEQWFESWFSFDRGDAERRFSKRHPDVFYAFPGAVGTGCNMAFRRSVFRDVGGFDELLGAGTMVGGADDLDMFARVLDADLDVVYTPHALVRHFHRTTPAALRRQFWSYGVAFGAVSLKFVLHRRPVRAAVVQHALDRIRTHHLRRLRARLRGHDNVPVRMILVDLAGTAAGPAVYVAAVLTAPLRRRTGPRR